MPFIGSSSTFTPHQRQIDIESHNHAQPTRIVHTCIGFGLGFIHTEFAAAPGQPWGLFLGTAVQMHDLGPINNLWPPAQWVPVQPAIIVQNGIPAALLSLGFVTPWGRRCQIERPGGFLRYVEHYRPRPGAQMIPVPSGAVMNFRAIEYGAQFQSWRRSKR
ncbi:hypothetical protein BD779DRAFT_1478720 [Infundibulicybe gibba]|nr:hypothetical protein BD779DRAFT_1478720 [Infundibulicybe gibba]